MYFIAVVVNFTYKLIQLGNLRDVHLWILRVKHVCLYNISVFQQRKSNLSLLAYSMNIEHTGNNARRKQWRFLKTRLLGLMETDCVKHKEMLAAVQLWQEITQ